MNKNMQIEGAMKQITYACGCICQFPIVGNFSELKEWHIISCYTHAKNIRGMEQKAELDFQRLMGERV